MNILFQTSHGAVSSFETLVIYLKVVHTALLQPRTPKATAISFLRVPTRRDRQFATHQHGTDTARVASALPNAHTDP
jgi:hypothetical protein